MLSEGEFSLMLSLKNVEVTGVGGGDAWNSGRSGIRERCLGDGRFAIKKFVSKNLIESEDAYP